jgi:chitodextrinase
MAQLNLTWTASTDNIAVTGYKIFRDGVQIGISAIPSYTDNGLAESTTYSYRLSSYDAAGNNSAQSASVSITTITTGTDTIAPTVPTNLTGTVI